MLKKFLLVGLFCALIAPGFARQTQDAGTKYKAAVAWLHKVEPQFSAETKQMVPAIEAILERYYMDPESLRASEKALAEAFIATMPGDDNSISGRGSADDRMKDFENLLGSAGPAKAPAKAPVKKTGSKVVKKPAKVVVKKPVTRHSTAKFKIPGITVRPTFSAVERSAPGGNKIGAVVVSIDGRKKTVIEILSQSGGFSLQKRAAIVAKRMAALSAKNPLWWTTAKGGSARGEAVVKVAGAPDGFLVTADKQFADACGMTPSRLASTLASKIRNTFDPDRGDDLGGRDVTPDDLRQAAIDLRQEGDELFSSSPSQAEAKYIMAIQNDRTYHVPYLRLADIYKSQGDVQKAKDTIDQALGVTGITGEQRVELEAKRKSLG